MTYTYIHGENKYLSIFACPKSRECIRVTNRENEFASNIASEESTLILDDNS